MKIVFVSNSLVPSKNANTVQVMKMCNAFAKNNIEIELICKTYNEVVDVDEIKKNYYVKYDFKIKPYYVNNMAWKSVLLSVNDIPKYIEGIYDKKNDIVYSRDLFAGFILRVYGYRVIYEKHFMEVSLIRKIIEYLLIKYIGVEKVIFISNALLKDYIKNKTYIKSKCLVAHDGADASEKINDINIKKRKKQGLKIGYIGSYCKGKGVELVIEIAKSMPLDEFHFVGVNELDVVHLYEKEKVKNMFYYGYIENSKVSKYINDFDVLLLPNQKNMYGSDGKINIGKYTSPLKLFEYMSAGKEIIASKLDSIEEVLNSSVAYMVESDNISEWIGAIEAIRKNGFTKGQKAHKLLIQKYTWDKRVDLILNS